MSPWWIAWAAGIGVLVLGGVVVARAHGQDRIPRLGFAVSPPRSVPRWTYAAWFFGPLLLVLASGRMTDSTAGTLGLLAAGVAASSVCQAIVVLRHNGRLARGPGVPGRRPG